MAGFFIRENKFFNSSDMDRYDPISNTWTVMTPMKKIKDCHKLIELNGFMYAFGLNSDGKPIAECYDVQQNEWTKVCVIWR